jgi:hypothetical protein
MKLRAPPALRDRVEKRSQVIENTLEPGSFFMKLRRPEGVGDKPEVTRSCKFWRQCWSGTRTAAA